MIPFADLKREYERLRPELAPAVAAVMESGDFVLGRHVAEFERAFADYCGASFGVGVNSGTSALHLTLLAAGVGPGDEVITSAFTFVATAAAIAYTGARPILVDVDPATLNLDIDRLEAAISSRTRAIVPVHLYGQAADMDPLLGIAERHGLAVIEDAAQAHGARYNGRPVGSLSHAACFSFYPSKNLGAAGEAGMVTTSRAEWAAQIRRLRNWGQATPYQYVERGFNHRMADIQAAVLSVKLRHLDEWNAVRRAHAAAYDAAFAGPALKPIVVRPWAAHVYYIYAVRAAQRPIAQSELMRRGIETRVHYPAPVHLLGAWGGFGYRAGDFPHAERAAGEVLSLPVHPGLTGDEVTAIARAIREVSIGDDAVLASASSRASTRGGPEP